jgi:hypothetical protein
MAVKQAISSVTPSNELLASQVAYFASFSGTSYSAQLEVNINGDWLPAAAAITQAGNMAAVAFAAGKSNGPEERFRWRWNVTAITAGTLTVYLG